MSRKARIIKLFVAALGLLGILGTEAVSYAALAKAQGKPPRYTGRLSSNPAIRKQQLIIDPEGILGGSVTVKYDPRIVRLVDAQDPADFAITGGFVDVVPEFGALPIRQPLDVFLANPSGTLGGSGVETGNVQVFFQDKSIEFGTRAGSPSVIPNLPGYFTVAQDGQTGINDTHSLLFEYLPGVNPRTRAGYTIFAAPPRGQDNGDFLIIDGEPKPTPFDQIGKASVEGSLVPLPPALIMGLSGLPLAFLSMAYLRRKAMQR